MEQIRMKLDVVEDIYMEVENKDHIEIVSYNMKEDLFKGKLKYRTTKDKLIDWFCEKYFKYELEISCEDLFNIAIKNNIYIGAN